MVLLLDGNPEHILRTHGGKMVFSEKKDPEEQIK